MKIITIQTNIGNPNAQAKMLYPARNSRKPARQKKELGRDRDFERFPQAIGIKTRQQRETMLFNKFLAAKGKVTPEEYENILNNHPSFIVKANAFSDNNYDGQTSPEQMAFIALRVNDYLGKKFNDFRIISIGTSPAPLSEQLEHLGNEVVYLPVSGLGVCYPNSPKSEKELLESDGLSTVLDYLDSKNIHDGKLNLVVDYTYSGKTLKTIARIMQKQEGANKRKVRPISLGKLCWASLTHTFGNPIHLQKGELYDSFDDDMKRSKFEKISNVPHFYLSPKDERYKDDFLFTEKVAGKDEEEIFTEFDSYSSPLARAYSLATLNEIKKFQSQDPGKRLGLMDRLKNCLR